MPSIKKLGDLCLGLGMSLLNTHLSMLQPYLNTVKRNIRIYLAYMQRCQNVRIQIMRELALVIQK